MQVRKAVITAAGRGTTQNPAADTVPGAMLPVVDRDGWTKPVIQVIAEEAVASGIEEICVIVAPIEEEVFRRAFHGVTPSTAAKGPAEEQARHVAEVGRRIQFVVQERPEGYGHSVWCAREFVGSDPFLLLVGDHLYVSGAPRRCARQVLDLAEQEDCSVAAVQATREHLIHRYGTVAGKRLAGRPNVFLIEDVVEKPTPSTAELRLQVPGLRVGHYLCFFGMHVLTPTIFRILDEHVRGDRRSHGRFELTPALQELARRERYLAMQTNGRRYDIGVRHGLLEAQLALAMAGADRDKLLLRLTELLVQWQQDASGQTGNGSDAAG